MNFFQRLFGPPSQDAFARLLIQALRKAGDARTPHYDKAEGRLTFTSDGKDAGTMHLRNLHAEYSSLSRKDRAAWLRRTIIGLINQMEMPEDFDDVKPDLFPTIRPKSMLEVMRLDAEVQGAETMDMACVPLSEHLVVCLVYDLPHSMRFINQKNLETWGVSLYEAAEAARHNLAEKPFSVAGIEGTFYILANSDAYDASRMLLTDAIMSLKLSGDPVALPIARDLLLIAGSDDAEGLGLMVGMAGEQKQIPRPVCPVPHRLRDGDWEAWMPPADSPHFQKLRRLEVEYLFGEYAEQKRLLELRHEQTGMDVFVATFTAIEKEDILLSYSLWSESVPTWLPRTQYVAFMNAEQQPLGLVPWERVEVTMGPAMQLLDCYPPRWFVDTFPDDAQLVEMKPQQLPE